jgi:transcriptional regulator with XRE-family HTH domain
MNETFAQILLRLRKLAGLIQKRLAEKSHISVEEISRLERDDTIKKPPTVIRYATLEALANGLGLSEGSPDRRQFFDAAAERNRQRRAEKSGIAPPMAPVPDKKPGDDVRPSGTVDLSQMRVFTRMEQVADCILWMLYSAPPLKKVGAGVIRDTTQGSVSMFHGLDSEERWSRAVRSAMEHKWKVVNLYRMTGERERIIEVIREIRNLAVYPEQYIPHCFRQIGALRPPYNILIVPSIGALWTFSTHNPKVVDAAFFYPDKPEFAPYISSLTKHFNMLFTETDQLARTYGRHSTEWNDTMTRVCQMEADEFLANNSIDTMTMPSALADEYLEKSLRREHAYSDMKFLQLKTHCIRRREAFERNVQSFTYRTMMPWHSFEDAVGLSENAPGQCRYLVSYASGPDQYITVDKSLAIAHMKHLIDDLNRYENYEIALIKDHPSVEDLLYAPWLVKGEVAVLTAIFTKSDDGQHPVFASEFELTETSLVRMYRQQFLTLWDEVADQDKAQQKENVIRELTQLLERARSNP